MCQFLSENIKQLSRSKQNYKVFQEDRLLKFKIVPQFIKENFLQLFIGVCNEYSDSMEKIHYANCKSYVKDITKVQIDIYTKYDTIYSDNPSNMKSKITKKPKSFDQGDKSIFHLANRESVLQ